MGDDHVAKGADRVVDPAAILDPEALGQSDLHGRDVVAVPDRFEHRVREPQVEDLDQAHLAEEVVDPVELRLVEVLMHLVVERGRRGDVVPEGFSTTTRADPVTPASASPLITVPNREGGISR